MKFPVNKDPKVGSQSMKIPNEDLIQSVMFPEGIDRQIGSDGLWEKLYLRDSQQISVFLDAPSHLYKRSYPSVRP